MERLRSTIKYFLTVTINLQRDKANHAFDLLLVYSLIAAFLAFDSAWGGTFDRTRKRGLGLFRKRYT